MEYYTVDDFASFKKYDVHVHLNTNETSRTLEYQ